MSPLNRSIFSFVGYHLILFVTLGLLVACSGEGPGSERKLPVVDTAEQGRFVYTLVPSNTTMDVHEAVMLEDKELRVACLIVSRTEPATSCVKL